MQYLIRSTDSNDLSGVEQLCSQFGFPAPSEKLLQRYSLILDYSSHCLLVAADPSGAILGWVHAYEAPSLLSDRTVEIGGLVIDEKCRRKGIGKALMDAVEAWARDRGFDEVLLATRIDRVDAQEFYQALGYGFVHTTHFLVKSLPAGNGAPDH